jgi:hypothetical protein
MKRSSLIHDKPLRSGNVAGSGGASLSSSFVQENTPTMQQARINKKLLTDRKIKGFVAIERLSLS